MNKKSVHELIKSKLTLDQIKYPASIRLFLKHNLEINNICLSYLKTHPQYLKPSFLIISILNNIQLPVCKCEKIGYRLIHIFEHEWVNNKNEIKQKLIDIFNNQESKFDKIDRTNNFR